MAAATASPPPTATSPGSPTSPSQRDSVSSIPQALSPPRKPLPGTVRKPVPSPAAAVVSEEVASPQDAPAPSGQTNSQHDSWSQPLDLSFNLNLNDAPQQPEAQSEAQSEAQPEAQPETAILPQEQESYTGLLSSPVSSALDLQLPFIEASKQQLAQDDISSPAAETSYPKPDRDPPPAPPVAMAEGTDSTATSPQDRLRKEDVDRSSRESDETTNPSQEPISFKSSATTSASSLSGINEGPEYLPDEDSPGSSIIEGNLPRGQSMQHLQNRKQEYPPRVSSVPNDGIRTPSNPELVDSAGNIKRHLTPTFNNMSRSSLPRPQSAYSVLSEGPRGRSPALMPGGSHMRAPSVQSRKSPDVRMSTYAELLNVPYPQQAPPPITMDNSGLRNVVGNNASLLSVQKTLEMYRQNVKKTTDFTVQYSFAVFLISVAQEQGLDFSDPKGRKNSPQPFRDLDSPIVEATVASPTELVREAKQILQRLASGGYPFAQYYLADGFASGLFNKGKEDYNQAFPLFVLAAKHGHAESAYRTALSYEFGWGCRKDPAKAVQFLRSAASKRHPGAMTRLGKACLSGDLGEKRYREGIKWLKLAAESADAQYNAAPYQLGCLYETGYGDDIFLDLNYAAELYTQAAELGHPEANFRMGDAYEHGLLNCPRDPALSVHFYTGAAERGHAPAMMGLCAWYMVGAPPMLEKDEEEAYEWARRSADMGFVKAQYAIGYFTEMGIGCRRDILEANVWYVKAADAGDERAQQRLSIIQAAVSGQGTPMDVASPRSGKLSKGGKDDKDCVVM
ncbi:chitin synthase activator [Trichoderma barbatum]